MLSKEVRKALADERREIETRKQDLATQIAALDVKIKSIDGVMGTPGSPAVGESAPIQKPIIALLRAHPYGMTPQDISRELLKQGHLDTPSRKLITSVWQVLYRLKRDNKIKVKTGGIHIWIGGNAYARPMKPGGVRETLQNVLQEHPEGLPSGQLCEELERRGVVATGSTSMPKLAGTVLSQMRQRNDVALRQGRWVWTGGVVSPAGGWNKMTPKERSEEMKRRVSRRKDRVPEASTNGNGNNNGHETPGLRETVMRTITEQSGITRLALRKIIEEAIQQTGKTPVSELLWVELAQAKKRGAIIERTDKLYLPVATIPASGQIVWGIRAIMKTHPAGITRATLIEKLVAQGYTVQGKQPFQKRVRNEISRMKAKKEVREKDEALFLTGKLPDIVRPPKPAPAAEQEAAKA